MDADTQNILALSRLEDALHFARMTAGTAAAPSAVELLRVEVGAVEVVDSGDPVTVAVLRRVVEESRLFLAEAA